MLINNTLNSNALHYFKYNSKMYTGVLQVPQLAVSIRFPTRLNIVLFHERVYYKYISKE